MPIESLAHARRHAISAVAGALCVLLAACSGGSGGASNPDGSGAPALSFSASPTAVRDGGFSELSWSASGARSCDASGGWSGAKGVSGSEDVGPLHEDTVYRLSCAGDGGAVSRQVTVTLDDGAGPRVTLTAEPAQIAVDGTATLSWAADGATSCTASGGWSGSRPTSGSFTTGPLSSSTSFRLSCSGASGTALASVTVQVLDSTLRWVKPTQNVDGSPLTDLAGYLIYWGSASRRYDSSVRIDDPNATEWEADIAPGTYHFAMTAIDVDGHESDYSNEVVMTIP